MGNIYEIIFTFCFLEVVIELGSPESDFRSEHLLIVKAASCTFRSLTLDSMLSLLVSGIKTAGCSGNSGCGSISCCKETVFAV